MNYERENWKAQNPNEPFEITPMHPLGVGCCVIVGLSGLLGFAWVVEAILRLVYGG